MPGGRPPKYNPKKHPALVEQLAKEHNTLIHIANGLDVHMDTLYDWSKKHPEFSLALKKARQILESRWIDMGTEMMIDSQNKSAAIWVFMMKNLCKWRDKADEEYQSEAEAKVTAEAKQRTREELLKLTEAARIKKNA